MKNFIKRYGLIFILLILVIVITSSFRGTTIETTGYNTNNVYNTIKELSSEKYNGRRYGTKENLEAVKYIESQFKDLGLKPVGDDDTFLRNHSEMAKSYSAIAELELRNRDGSIAKRYKYGEDFIEQSYGYTVSGDITSEFNLIDYTKGKSFEKAKSDKSIAVVTSGDSDTKSLIQLSMELRKADYTALLRVVADDYNLGKESGSLEGRTQNISGYEIPTLIIKESVYTELENYAKEGHIIHAKTTFDVRLAPVADVIGMIPGKNDGFIIITAHLDNVGPSSDGTIYPGALRMHQE